MCWPARWNIHAHLQTVTTSCDCPHLPENCHINPHTQNFNHQKHEWFPGCCSHPRDYKMLWEIGAAYRRKRSTDDTNSIALHAVLTQLENPNSDIRILFVGYSSALNSINPIKLVNKLQTLGLGVLLSPWIKDFLISTSQRVSTGHNFSSTITLSTGVP